MKRVYLAAPFFNDEQIERVDHVAKVLREVHGLDVFSPREHQMKGLEFLSDDWRDAVFANDVAQMHKCDFMVAIYDGNDAGTYFETGFAYANRIPLVVFNEIKGTANLMITESARAWLYTREQLSDYDFENLPRRDRYRGDMV